jgi:hypothetical protein
MAKPHVSTLLAGVFGTLMVLLAALLFGKVMTPKNKFQNKQISLLSAATFARKPKQRLLFSLPSIGFCN